MKYEILMTTTRTLLLVALLVSPTVAWARGPTKSRFAHTVTSQVLRNTNVRVRAVALVKMGNQKLAGGYYAEALTLFKHAYRIYPSPKLHFNLAQTYGVLARPLPALQHYELFLKQAGGKVDTKRWVLAHQQIFRLLGQIATLQLQVNIPGATVSLDGKRIGVTPIKRPLRITADGHVIIVTKLGYERRVISFQPRAGQNLTRRVKLLTEQLALAKRRLVQELQARKRAVQERLARARAQNRRRRQRLRKALKVSGWTAVGVGLAAGIVAGVLGGLYQREVRALESTQDQYWLDGPSARKSLADRYKFGFYASVGVGGALLITGTVLAILGARIRLTGPERHPSTGTSTSTSTGTTILLTPVLGPRSAGASLQLRF